MSGAPVGRWPSAATTVVGVMGDPIAHSLSPLLHNTAFAALGIDWVSVAFPVPAGEAARAIGALSPLGIAGVSVTMPHKTAAFELVDESSPIAQRLGAVNCVVNRDGRLLGTNTDGLGFVESLTRGAAFDPAGRRALVVGAGGAARAVIVALADADAAEVVVVARRPEPAQSAASLAGDRGRVGSEDDVARVDLVVNATPVGMEGHGNPMLPAHALHTGQVVVDLVYEPAQTAWMREAAARGATVLGGLGMLVHQAAEQLRLWTGLEPPVEAMWEAVGNPASA